MDVELLSALRDSLSRPDRVIFLQKSYNILCKFGRGKGFRKSTWWNTPFCRAQLADFFHTTNKVLRPLCRNFLIR